MRSGSGILQDKHGCIALAAVWDASQLPDMTSTTDGLRLVSRTTQKTARYALLGTQPERAQRVWFALHGYGQLVPRFVRHFAAIIPPDTCLIAPEGLSRFYLASPSPDGGHLQRVGATWMTREEREHDIADNIRWLDTVYDDVVGDRIVPVGVLGFSQGVATATRWIAAGHPRVDAFVAWAGTLAHDVPPHALSTALVHAQVAVVRGTRDELMSEDAAASLLGTLQQIAPRTALHRFDGGHQLEGALLSMLLESLSPRGDQAP